MGTHQDTPSILSLKSIIRERHPCTSCRTRREVYVRPWWKALLPSCNPQFVYDSGQLDPRLHHNYGVFLSLRCSVEVFFPCRLTPHVFRRGCRFRCPQ